MFVVVFVGGIGEKSQCESKKGRKQFGFHGYEVYSFGVVWQTALRIVPQGGNLCWHSVEFSEGRENVSGLQNVDADHC
jgi:hypothetical protein